MVRRARGIRLLVLDVDGVLTDGRLVYNGDEGQALAFDIHDGMGVKLALKSGLRVAVISGRSSEMLARRARELGVTDLAQGVEDKRQAFQALLDAHGMQAREAACMGDDLPDLPLLRAAGLAIGVPDAAEEVIQAAHYVTRRPGGRGAVREAVELLLKAQGRWEAALEAYR